MQLIITLRKKVADQPEAQQIYEFVKQKLESRPDVTISAHCSNHFVVPEPPNGPD